MTTPPPETPPETPPEPGGADQDPSATQSPAASDALGSSARSKPPSLAPGAALLGLAGVLIVVVLVKPDMPDWLRTTIAILAVVVVIGLLAYAFVVFRETTRGGSR